ncbi:MAG: hypothetical protein U9P71_01180 [Campylobacterota bacterium]|nr:hypothetical protein [Campylobacterota bacterium]
MVKSAIVLFLIVLPLFSESLLLNKIESLIGEKSFNKNNSYIKIIFSPESDYYKNERVDVVKVVQTLKDNGLLKLFFESPKEIELSFSTNAEALFFVKIIEDTLQDMGYYKYLIVEAKLNSSEFIWKIKLIAEYIMDPIVLKQELKKRASYLVNIERLSPTAWHYEVDISRAHLDAYVVVNNKKTRLKNSQYAYWLDVASSKELVIESRNRNRWYPYVALYDAKLRLLDLIKKDERTPRLSIPLPEGTTYVKLDDMYSMKNIKDGFEVKGR